MKQDKKTIRTIIAIMAVLSIFSVLIELLSIRRGIYVVLYYYLFVKIPSIPISVYLVKILFPIGVFITVLIKKYTFAARILFVQYQIAGILGILEQILIFRDTMAHVYIYDFILILINIVTSILLLIASSRKKSAEHVVIVGFVMWGLYLLYQFLIIGFEMPCFLRDLTSATLSLSVICLFITDNFEEKKRETIFTDSDSFSFEKKDIASSIIFSIITCGIYAIIWLVEIVKNVHKLNGNDNEPVTSEVLLIIFIPFYFSYWVYKNGKQMHEDSLKYGGNIEDNSVMYMVLALFGLGLIDYALIQNDFNKFETKKINAFGYDNNQSLQQLNSGGVSNALMELQKLKEAGLVTDEEFTRKRNEILDRL